MDFILFGLAGLDCFVICNVLSNSVLQIISAITVLEQTTEGQSALPSLATLANYGTLKVRTTMI